MFRASRLSKGNRLFPTQVIITPHSVVHYTPQWIGKHEHSIHIAHVASVSIDTGLLFSDVIIETTGGSGSIRCRGHRKGDAVRMKQLDRAVPNVLLPCRAAARRARRTPAGRILRALSDVLTLPIRSVTAATPSTRLLRLDLGAAPFVFRVRPGGAHRRARTDAATAVLDRFVARRCAAASADRVPVEGRQRRAARASTCRSSNAARASISRGRSGRSRCPMRRRPAYLFVAGGTGIAPLRAMLRHLIAIGGARADRRALQRAHRRSSSPIAASSNASRGAG